MSIERVVTIAPEGAASPPMSERVRAHDWSTTPLGAPASWPRALHTAMDIVTSSRQQMFVAWGSELTFIYNDAYAEILGNKHPAALGRAFRDVWSDIWDDIKPLIDRALAARPHGRKTCC